MASIAKKILFDAQALAGASTNSTPVSLDGRTDNFIAFLKVTAVGAGSTLATKIQHSPNGSDWFDLVAFTNATGATAESKDQASFGVPFQNVYPWVRAVGAITVGVLTATATVELYFDPVK